MNKPQAVLAVIFTLGLVGCTTSVVSSNPRSVVVESQALDAAEAQRLADTECQKHHRYAQMTIPGGYWNRHYTFACVE
ncbi:hypothetical protein D3C77_467600 [compost metagenome]